MPGTWTYSRGGEMVEIHHIEHEGKAELTVHGLGPTCRREFNSLEAQLLYVTTLDGNLVAAGWSLSHFRPERRGGPGLRTPRAGRFRLAASRSGAVIPTKRSATK